MPDLSPAYDYVSPTFAERVNALEAFPGLVEGPRRMCGEQIDPHRYFVQPIFGATGTINTDEGQLLYQYAKQFAGKRALEIGCHIGFSAWHLLKGGVRLSVCDPVLADPPFRNTVDEHLKEFWGSAETEKHYELLAMHSPDGAFQLRDQHLGPWSLVFIDGNHHSPHPQIDALAAQYGCADDAVILFHDVVLGAVADAISMLKAYGWNARLYRTSMIIGACWRGKVEPVEHVADPVLQIPSYLADLLD